MSASNEQWIVQPGTDVYGSDGTRVGSVDTIEGEYLVLRQEASSPRDQRIPFSAIAGHSDDRIDLNVSSDQAGNEDWGGQSRGITTTSSSAGSSRSALSEATAPDDETDMMPFEHHTGGVAHTEDDQDIYIPVVEEELTASRRGVERGVVRVETNVTEREETLSVPVTEERIRVERHTVDRDATAADMNRDGATIDVPVYGEEVDMNKRARVVEEV